jgi:hypothetical protein
MKKLVLLLLLITVAAVAGCGARYNPKVFGVSGKTYTAPDICQAVAQCVAAGETKCFYGHDGFSCTEKEEQPPKK